MDVKDTLNAAEEASPQSPTILITHASVGSGHRSAANAIAQAFELLKIEDNDTDNAALEAELTHEKPRHAKIPADLNVEVLDILDYGLTKVNGDKAASMFTGATRPIYDLTWRYALTGRLLWGGGTIWGRIFFQKFTNYVRRVKPLAVIATHITAANAAVSARMITGQTFPIVCVPTDYEVEGLWPHLSTDLFCVANERMAETLRPRHIPEERILITGIPTRPVFRNTYDRDAVRDSFSLPKDKYVVLVQAGAYLPRPYVRFREAIDHIMPHLGHFKSMHFVFIAGKDKEYAEHLRRRCKKLALTNATILEYVEEMAALMSASDLTICKSGGLTVTECLVAHVPMVLLGRAYGQEKANVSMLTASGAALHVITWRELLDVMNHINKHPESTKAMLVNASFVRKPNAAIDIAHATYDLALDRNRDPFVHRKRIVRMYWGDEPAHNR